MIEREEIYKYLEPKLGQSKYTSQGLNFCCPTKNCDLTKTKYNLEISLNKEIFHCWACHYSGTIRKLFEDHAIIDGWQHLFKNKVSIKKVEEKKDIVLPECFNYNLSDIVKDYFKTRKIDSHLLKERKVKALKIEDEYSIIFPFYEDKELKNYVTLNLKTGKYKNAATTNYVPYKEYINPFFPIILTEGVFDALSVPNAIPLLGTLIQSKVFEFCLDKNIILAFDSDVGIEKVEEATKKLLFNGAKSVYVFKHQYKDLNEYKIKDEKELKEKIKEIYKSYLIY